MAVRLVLAVHLFIYLTCSSHKPHFLEITASFQKPMSDASQQHQWEKTRCSLVTTLLSGRRVGLLEHLSRLKSICGVIWDVITWRKLPIINNFSSQNVFCLPKWLSKIGDLTWCAGEHLFPTISAISIVDISLACSSIWKTNVMLVVALSVACLKDFFLCLPRKAHQERREEMCISSLTEPCNISQFTCQLSEL